MSSAFENRALAYAFAAATVAFVPSALLLTKLTGALERALPSECNAFLDAVFWLDAASIHPHLRCMGDAGRAMHLDMYKFDLVLFPIIYGTMLFGALTLAWPRVKLPRLVAVATVCCDVLENASNTFLLLQFPQRSRVVELCASIASRGKYVGLIASLVCIAVGVVWRGWTRVTERAATPEPRAERAKKSL